MLGLWSGFAPPPDAPALTYSTTSNTLINLLRLTKALAQFGHLNQKEKHQHNSNALFFPNGAAASFADTRIFPISEMEAVTDPIIGLSGGLGTASDIKWVVELVQHLPEVRFVFLRTTDHSELLHCFDQQPNVLLKGFVSHEELMPWFRRGILNVSILFESNLAKWKSTSNR